MCFHLQMIDSSPPVDIDHLAPWLGDRSFADWRAEFDAAGYVVFERAMTPDQVEAVRGALAPHLGRDVTGRNDFEGYRSNRVYGLLAKSPGVFGEMVTHPLPLAFAEADLGTSCLLSALLAINLHPGETEQAWHWDDGHISIPLPHPSFGVSAFWAIDDLTDDNGATEILPGSHRWDADDVHRHLSGGDFVNRLVHDPPEHVAHDGAVRITMPAGSVMLAKGTLWHRGGANRSDRDRLIVTPQYCPGWSRQLENMVLAVPPDVAADLPQRVRELIGYSIHAPFMGYVDGVHPAKVLQHRQGVPAQGV